MRSTIVCLQSDHAQRFESATDRFALQLYGEFYWKYCQIGLLCSLWFTEAILLLTVRRNAISPNFVWRDRSTTFESLSCQIREAWQSLSNLIVAELIIIRRCASAVLLSNLIPEFRASSYEPGNRAGSVTGTNFVICSYGKFQPGRPG